MSARPRWDRLYYNARFFDPATDLSGADALAVAGGRIGAIGQFEELAPSLRSGAEPLDLEGACIIPGPVDAHVHLVSHGFSHRLAADLRGCRSIEEIVGRLREHARSHLRPNDGAWLLGRGFDQEMLTDGRWPTRTDLEGASPERPCRISRVCGHALVANSLAEGAAAITAPAPEGLYTEERMGPFFAALPEPTLEEWLHIARWAVREAARVGYTGVHCLVAGAHELRALHQLHEAGELPIRVRLQIPFSLLSAARELGQRTGFGDQWLHLGSVKIFSDGSFGARTAALREPYHDAPGNSGELIRGADELTGMVREVAATGFQVCIHAIGDLALEAVLTAFERVAAERPLWRPRVEHASTTPPDLIRRMKAMGAVAVVQPQFVESDFWLDERLGPERIAWGYAFRSLLDGGVPVAGSSDCPVEELNALEAIGAAVARPGAAWAREHDQELTVAQAVEVFTHGSAYAGGWERELGRLRSGYLADFVALDGDPREVRPAAIRNLQVVGTVVGGELVYPN